MQAASEPILAVDPAMLEEVTGDDSEYEYEYDETQTETFYLNLDLTSYHGPIRPPRRRQSQPDSAHSSTSFSFPSPAIAPLPTDDNDTISADPTGAAGDSVQILGLHTRNPIVSYQNQIFSCSWADLLGTEMLFAHPEVVPISEQQQSAEVTYLRRGKDFDLIAANSVKILGRKANLISSSGAGPAARDAAPSSTTATAAAALTGSQTAEASHATDSPRRTIPETNQARFLQRLMNVKQAKGETDTVRTVFNLKRGQRLGERLRGWARTEEQMAEIQRLNRGVLEGDLDALVALEKLYAQVERSQDIGTPMPLEDQRFQS